MADVSLRGISKSYGKVEVLHDISLEVKDGEFVVFVGPSGCGKSTALRIIAGLEEITKGQLYIGGRLVNEVPPADRGIAMVFQSYALYPHMTVYKNMAFGLKFAKTDKSETDRRVREAAEILQLTPYLERKPRDLSGGQRQRVAIGRAIVREPAVFLFDEPLSNLDAALRINTRIEIAKLHRSLKATTIYVTHDQVRGDDPRDQDRGAEPGPRGAGRSAARALPPPAEPVRGGLHRLAQDELREGPGGRGRRQGADGRLRRAEAGG